MLGSLRKWKPIFDISSHTLYRQSTIANSEIRSLTQVGEVAIGRHGGNGNNAVVESDGTRSSPQSDPMQTMQQILLSEDWTKLSNTIFMFNKKALNQHSEVYRGKQLHASGRIQEVVVKLLKETGNQTQEVNILLKLSDHPNIVRILESGKCKGTVPQIYVVMERCLQNLNEYFQENLFSLPKATTFFLQTVSAIVFIHDNNIAHRDLKPSNILITLDNENIKVSDFGISKEFDGDRSQVTVTHASAGTEGYKAPETYLGKTSVGYKVDIYSLGICGCIIMTHGKHPFGPNPHMWTANIMANRNCDLSQIPVFPQPNPNKRTQLVELLKGTLNPNPKDRPSALQVQNHVFFKVLEDRQPKVEQSNGILSFFKSFFNGKDPKKTRVKLEKQSKELMESLKYEEAASVSRDLVNIEGSNIMELSLQIVECEIRLKSAKVQESLQKLRYSIPASKSTADLIEMSRDLTRQRLFIRALILLRIASEKHQIQRLPSDDAATWICDTVCDVRNVATQLITHDSTLEQEAIDISLSTMEELLCDLRSMRYVSNDVKARNIAKCLVDIAMINEKAREYSKAIHLYEEGIACLSDVEEKSSKYLTHGSLLTGLANAHCRLKDFTRAENFYVLAMQQFDRVDFTSETERHEVIDPINLALELIVDFRENDEIIDTLSIKIPPSYQTAM